MFAALSYVCGTNIKSTEESWKFLSTNRPKLSVQKKRKDNEFADAVMMMMAEVMAIKYFQGLICFHIFLVLIFLK